MPRVIWLLAFSLVALGQDKAQDKAQDYKAERTTDHGIPVEFPEAAVAEAEAARPVGLEGRTDLRQMRMRLEKETGAAHPLKAGRYRFYDDYHEATTEGFLVIQ